MTAARVLAASDMAAESRRAAGLDGAHHFELPKADMAAISLTPCGAVAAEDVRDLQQCRAMAAGYSGLPSFGRSGVSLSSGLMT